MIDGFTHEQITAAAKALPDDLSLIAYAFGYKFGLTPGSCDQDFDELVQLMWHGARIGYGDMCREQKYG